jgi:heavy metal sensor kinase
VRIRTRLTIWYAAALTLIVLGVSGFVVWRLRADLMQSVDASLTVRSQQTTVAVEDPLDVEETIDLELFDVPDLVAPPGTVTQVIGSDGRLMRSMGDGISTALLGPRAARSLRGPVRFVRESGTETYRCLATRLERSDSTLVVCDSLAPVERTTRGLLGLLAIAIPVGIAMSVALGYWLAGRGLRPIDRMTRDAAAIGADDVGKRLDQPASDDEVGRLGRTLNGMLDRLQQAIVEQRRFTSDASHELRTPLAVMRTEIDVALRSPDASPDARTVLASMREEVDRMTRIVDDLLTLARADEGRLDLVGAEIDLAEVARSVGERLAPTTNGTTIDVDASRAIVWGDRDRLDQLVSNLIDNAVKHSPDGGRVRVSVRSDAGSALLVVTDDGPGIAADDLPRVFDRFYRSDASRSRATGGAGLGLAICRTIARAHRGDVEAHSPHGSGAVFTVRLPADV